MDLCTINEIHKKTFTQFVHSVHLLKTNVVRQARCKCTLVARIRQEGPALCDGYNIIMASSIVAPSHDLANCSMITMM